MPIHLLEKLVCEKTTSFRKLTSSRLRMRKIWVAVSKKLKPNEKILIRVYSQGRSGYVALAPR